MIKLAQDTAPPAGAPPEPSAPTGGDSPSPEGGGGAGPGPSPSPFSPSPPPGGPGEEGAAPAAPNAMPSESDPSKIFYKALATPSDIVNDYKLEDALKSGKSPDLIAQEIWVAFGGDETGIRVDGNKLGVRNPDNKITDPKVMDDENKSTDKSKWQRLKAGLGISDIFEDQREIYYLVLNYIASEIKAKKTQSKAFSWYRYAQNNH